MKTIKIMVIKFLNISDKQIIKKLKLKKKKVIKKF